MLDIDRIQNVLSGKLTGRGCGKTTAMIASILSHADILDRDSDIFIFCGTRENADRIKEQTYRIAEEMGFTTIAHFPLTRKLRCAPNSKGCCVFLHFEAMDEYFERKILGKNASSIYTYHDSLYYDVSHTKFIKYLEQMRESIDFSCPSDVPG